LIVDVAYWTNAVLAACLLAVQRVGVWMVSVLIVDDDTQLRRALTRALNAHGFESESAAGYSEALTCLDQKPYDVVITDLRMGEKDGIDLITAIRDSTRHTRPILMSAYATAKDSQRAFDLGAIRVLCKPFETREVIEAIERAVDSSTGYVGVVHGLSLIDMLQMFHYGRRSLALDVLGKTAGSISIKDGEIVDARYGSEAGEPALRSMLTLAAGSLRTRSLQGFTSSIHRDFQNLLLDLLREVDEQSVPPGPPMASDSAIINGWDGRISSQPIVRLEASSSLPPDTEQLAGTTPRAGPPRTELDPCCRDIVTQVAGAIACEVLDLSSGEVLAAHGSADTEGAPSLPSTPLIQLFRGVPAPQRDPDGQVQSRFDEFQLASKEQLHFAKALGNRRAIVVVTTRRNASIALGWAQLRSSLPALDAVFARHEAGAAAENRTLPRAPGVE
jgi:ActR/RegA family two-component response regulator